MTLSLIVALIPFNILIHSVILILLISFNGNLFIFLLITPILKILTNQITRELHEIGKIILTFDPLKPIFFELSEIPLLIFSNWNNTITMGTLLLRFL